MEINPKRAQNFHFGKVKGKYLIFDIFSYVFDKKKVLKFLHRISPTYRFTLVANYLSVNSLIEKVPIFALHLINPAPTLAQLRKLRLRVELDQQNPEILFSLEFIDTVSLSRQDDHNNLLEKFIKAGKCKGMRKMVVNIKKISDLHSIFINEAVYQSVSHFEKLEIRYHQRAQINQQEYNSKPQAIFKIKGRETMQQLASKLREKVLNYNIAGLQGKKEFISDLHRFCGHGAEENFKLIVQGYSPISLDKEKLQRFKEIEVHNKRIDYEFITISNDASTAIKQIRELSSFSTSSTFANSELFFPLMSFEEVMSGQYLPFRKIWVNCDTDMATERVFMKQPKVKQITIDLQRTQNQEKIYGWFSAFNKLQKIRIKGFMIHEIDSIQEKLKVLYIQGKIRQDPQDIIFYTGLV
ncbi:hypothetical protein FGO68_gene9253 [Halteria grandinella]|uniref:Uncharacterized protein n=1 Tax=Halteria grandinella TaxID=5974 RepID=A0A8J8T0Y1_HALGN|nr:hypothetical protein FGO68_gene9253 [Halteria grandinella]